MILNHLSALFRFRNHLKYHRDIIKHLRWTDKDDLRLNFYKDIVGPKDLVFDVGANMGNRSKIFRAIGARVVAFEPQSYCASFLKAAFSNDAGFTLVQEALSDHEGEMMMHLSDAHVLSTLDTGWIERMNQGGRFQNQWNKTEKVIVSTLDKAIESYGTPSFIKIDVEGHELNVLRGLSKPVKQLSLEFASESLDNIYKCVDHLDSLASYEYRLSMGESMNYYGDNWSNGREIKALLNKTKETDPLVWGDIYARHTCTKETLI